MAIYDLRGLGDDFVIHYGSEQEEIDAYTLSNSLLALSNALQAINREINPDFSLEISVVALGGGSFRPRIKTKAKRLASLLAHDFRSIIVQVLAVLIATRLLSNDPDIEIKILEDRVEFQSRDDLIILPKEAFEPSQRVRANPEIDRSIRQNFQIIEEDTAVTSFGLAGSLDEHERLPLEVDRGRFGLCSRPQLVEPSRQREIIEEDAELVIVRAIFEDSDRRWQFVWRGISISAPILDKEFRADVVHRRVSITHGDIFVVDLRILQTANEAGIMTNDTYEVLRVKEHQSGPAQSDLITRDD